MRAVSTSSASDGGGRPTPRRHSLRQGAVPKEELNRIFPQLRAAFHPQTVRYGNTNPNIRKSDGEHGESIEWKVSCYLEISSSGGGAKQKGVQTSQELRDICAPLLEHCDRAFVDFYTALHGAGSITALKRMQSFVTRYRPNPNESGLLRHIDGANVDGSIILALTGADGSGAPIDVPFTAGGVTVWEREPGNAEEVAFEYPMRAGDVCALDNYIWHQGNPITSGERWALVIFYQTKAHNDQHRLANIVVNMARQIKAETAAAKVATDGRRRAVQLLMCSAFALAAAISISAARAAA